MYAIRSYYAQKAFDVAIPYGNLEAIKKAAEILSETYAAGHEYKKAYDFHVMYKNITDSLVNEKTNKSIYNLKISYETEKKEQQIDYLAKENKAQKTTNIIMVVALIV